MRYIFPIFLVCLALCSCHRDSQVELRADAYCTSIIEALKNGNTQEAERQVKAMNAYARSLTDDSLQIFMLRYETHSEAIAAAASQGIKGVIQQATNDMQTNVPVMHIPAPEQ